MIAIAQTCNVDRGLLGHAGSPIPGLRRLVWWSGTPSPAAWRAQKSIARRQGRVPRAYVFVWISCQMP